LFGRSWDDDFYKPALRHAGYCLVWLDVSRGEIGTYIRRFLKHPDFNSMAKRLGNIVRVAPSGLHVWRINAESEILILWPKG